MKNVLEFLTKLHRNNNKPWFDEHRKEYLQAKGEFEGFVEKLIERVSEFDPTVAGLELKQCTYRINRDVRFSANKDPYKTHFGAFLAPGGKNSGYGGYYFHIEPQGVGFVGGHMIATGTYMHTPKELESIRTEIFDHPEAFVAALAQADGFVLDESEMLKKAPKGFPADFKYVDYLKRKHFSLNKLLTDSDILADNLLDRVVAEFRKTKEFKDILNRSIEFAKNEE